MAEERKRLQVVPIRASEPNPDVVAWLEEKLAQAKGGELRGLIAVIEYDGSEYGHAHFYSKGTVPARLIGELQIVSVRRSLAEMGRREEA